MKPYQSKITNLKTILYNLTNWKNNKVKDTIKLNYGRKFEIKDNSIG